MIACKSLLGVLFAAACANSVQAQNLFEGAADNDGSTPGGRASNFAAKASKQEKFDYGVASGDPLATSVILWTHVEPPHSNGPVSLTWEVSTDEFFDDIVASGTVDATLDTDHTAKVDAEGLEPGTEYWYRFMQGRRSSPIGRTRTLPPVGVDEVKFAVFSCSNYPAGHFHAYKDAVERGAKFALHLGDYIYEYPADGYASEQAEAMGRKSDPETEVITLKDYRRRHAQYRSDPDAQLMHAAMPLIAIWDDHETANDAYMGGAANHDPATEGTWQARMAAAIQAYHEWMPIRTGPVKEKIYRSFDFGDLLSLHMIDTRLIGRDKQADPSEAPSFPIFLSSLFSPTRELLGQEQSIWLQGQFTNSPGKWQILGNQVLMSRMEVPLSILQYLGGDGLDQNNIPLFNNAVTAYITAKQKKVANIPLNQAELDLLDTTKNPKIGYNNDDWNGYPIAREKLLNGAAMAFAARDRKLLVLAGDTHNSWYADVAASGYFSADGGLAADTVVGIQIATPSVSSPGLEYYLSAFPEAQVNQLFRGIIDDIKWMEASQRGWVMLTVSPSAVQADWIFVGNVFVNDFISSIVHSETVPAN